jgi:isopenicillin N synthase-like dioxygenase
MNHHMSALRLVHYYPLALLTDVDDDSPDRVRAGAHTDYGALTILNAQQAGLQVLVNNSEWYAVPVVPNALIINLGDLMQRWTNGTYATRARGKD